MKWIFKKYENVSALADAYRRGERPRIYFAKHFAERMLDMGVSEGEIFDAIAAPDRVGRSEKHNACLLDKGRIVLSLRVDSGGYPIACTLLWRYREDWVDAAREGRLGGQGRRLRADLSHLPSRSLTD